MNAIVYTSNTGFTAEYARLLGAKTGLPVYSFKEAVKQLPAQSEVIYLGWLMGGMVNHYRKAAEKFRVCAVCAVGMTPTDEQLPEIRTANSIPQDFPLFALQGGLDRKKLHGLYKMMMNMASKGIEKQINEKPEQTAEDRDMLELMHSGGSRVSAERLEPVLAWYQNR